MEVGRMKTGTPARIDRRSIDFSKLVEQEGEMEGRKFSYLDYTVDYSRHLSCYIAYTNLDVHASLEEGFEELGIGGKTLVLSVVETAVFPHHHTLPSYNKNRAPRQWQQCKCALLRQNR